MEKTYQCVFNNCGHGCCETCKQKMGRCPICRSQFFIKCNKNEPDFTCPFLHNGITTNSYYEVIKFLTRNTPINLNRIPEFKYICSQINWEIYNGWDILRMFRENNYMID